MRPSSLKYAFVFAALGGAVILAATQFGGRTWLFAGPTALAFAGVATAYVLRRPQLLGKRADGRLSPLIAMLLGPYHLMNWLSLALFRASREAPYS